MPENHPEKHPELYRNLTTNNLKKLYSSRWVGGAECGVRQKGLGVAAVSRGRRGGEAMAAGKTGSPTSTCGG